MKTLMLMVGISTLLFSLSASSQDAHDKIHSDQQRSHSIMQNRNVERHEMFHHGDAMRDRDHSRREDVLRVQGRSRDDERFRHHNRFRDHDRFYTNFPTQIYIQSVQPYTTDCCQWNDGICGCSNGVAICCDGELIPDCDDCY